jgi:tRNA threonylcarbamoyladenosine biosynthesis protein TsaB
MALILSIETSEKICSIALGSDYELIGTLEISDEKSHASMLTVLIEKLLHEKDIKINQLNAVAISKGPGSYTGLRIGVSCAKGISYALQLPLISVNTLQSLAQGFIQSRYVSKMKIECNNLLLCPMIDARRMEVYRAIFNLNTELVGEIEAEIIDENSFRETLQTNKVVFFGSGAEKCKHLIQHPNAFFADGFRPNASYMISFAFDSFLKNEFEDPAYFEPFYLKDFITTIPKHKSLVL